MQEKLIKSYFSYMTLLELIKFLLYLCTRRVARTGSCGRSLCGAVRALGRQPSAAVRVAEALAVLFADLSK